MSRRLLRSVPRSPFSTPLSGSARETEERIRNIFQYKKKRPPLLLFVLACALALTCGGLVSCESPNAPSSDPADTSSQQAGFSLDARAQELVQALTPEDLPKTTVEQTWSHTLDREVLLDALAQGVQSPLDPDQFQPTEFWQFRTGPVHLNALAGAEQEGYLLVTLSDDAGWESSFAVYHPDLWDNVRQLFRREGQVDRNMLSQVQDRIDQKITQMCADANVYYEETGTPSANFTGGDIVDFQLQGAFEAPGGNMAYLYSLDIALVCQYPERIALAGGTYADEQGRMRDHYQLAEMAILEEDGVVSKCVFLAGDTIGILGSDEASGTYDSRRGTLAALELAPDGGSL